MILRVETNTFKDVSDLTLNSVLLNAYNQDVKIVALKVEDRPNHFGTQEWNNITQRIVGAIVDTMKNMKDGELLMYCDTDILILHPMKWFFDQLGNNDFIFQYETGFGPNFGFFVVRVSPETIKLLEETRDATVNGVNSQIAFKQCVAKSSLKITYFDVKDVWNYAVQSGGAIWNPGDKIEWPQGIKAFHANFTIGNKNKVDMLTQAIKHYA